MLNKEQSFCCRYYYYSYFSSCCFLWLSLLARSALLGWAAGWATIVFFILLTSSPYHILSNSRVIASYARIKLPALLASILPPHTSIAARCVRAACCCMHAAGGAGWADERRVQRAARRSKVVHSWGRRGSSYFSNCWFSLICIAKRAAYKYHARL